MMIQELNGSVTRKGWANFLACMKAWLEYSVSERVHLISQMPEVTNFT